MTVIHFNTATDRNSVRSDTQSARRNFRESLVKKLPTGAGAENSRFSLMAMTLPCQLSARGLGPGSYYQVRADGFLRYGRHAERGQRRRSCTEHKRRVERESLQRELTAAVAWPSVTACMP